MFYNYIYQCQQKDMSLIKPVPYAKTYFLFCDKSVDINILFSVLSEISIELHNPVWALPGT